MYPLYGCHYYNKDHHRNLTPCLHLRRKTHLPSSGTTICFDPMRTSGPEMHAPRAMYHKENASLREEHHIERIEHLVTQGRIKDKWHSLKKKTQGRVYHRSPYSGSSPRMNAPQKEGAMQGSKDHSRVKAKHM